MTRRCNILTSAILFVFLITGATIASAEVRGTPTIVTNDATSPVVVTGEVSASKYKPVGITTEKIAGSATAYAKGALCLAEFQDSRMCSTMDLLNNIGAISVGSEGAWILPTIVMNVNTTVFDVSGVSTYYTNVFIFKDNDILYSTGTYLASVLCCAP